MRQLANAPAKSRVSQFEEADLPASDISSRPNRSSGRRTRAARALATIAATCVPLAANAAPICPPDMLLTKRINCLVAAARARGEPSLCLTAEDPVRFQCITLYAERTGNTSPCALLKGSGQQSRLLQDSCLAGVAIAAIDPGICSEVRTASVADSCYTQLVVKRGADASLCEKVGSPYLHKACLGR